MSHYFYRRFVLATLKHARQLWARLTGRRFCCLALSGKVRDGIFINSDMTVSCNCQDIDAGGRIGDLRQTPFPEIFAGPQAQRLRAELAAGRLPVERCAACFHLRTVPKAEAAQGESFVLPRGLCVENTVHCNLRCLSCCREQIVQTRARKMLTLDDFEIVAAALRDLDAEFCGFYNLGEPFFAKAVRSQLEIVRQQNPEIEILVSTNGMLLDTDEKREAALLASHILFSIDGIDTPMLRRYQRGGDFDRSYRNMKDLVEFRNARGLTRPRIDWKYVVFRWNDRPRDIERAIELAREAGVDSIQFTFARTPAHGISWRWLLTPYFRRLGNPDGPRGRVVPLAATCGCHAHAAR